MKYDSIIIGSGISGLTAASLLAKIKGEKVLVLEQHGIIGGFTHTFRRGKFEWDTGLHYVGNMGDSDFPRRLMDFITDREVHWLKMPDPFELFHFPGFHFAQRSGEKQLIGDLSTLFPDDHAVIEKYFKTLSRAQIWSSLHFASRILPPFLGWIPRLVSLPLRHLSQMNLAEYFEKEVANLQLRAVLTGPCGDYGLAPSQASLAIHALIVRHYIEGGYYPRGGAGSLPNAIRGLLEKYGVDVKKNHNAIEILTESNNVVGVRAIHRGQEIVFRSKNVFSCVGARQTYGELLKVHSPAAKAIAEFPPSMTMVTVYLGLKESPACLGFKGENHWIFGSTDFEAMHAAAYALDNDLQGCYISFPSLKDAATSHHTVEIMVPTRFDLFNKAADGRGWQKRGPEYEMLKKDIEHRVLNFVEKKFPGFRSLIEFSEVSTPLSIAHFTKHANGEAYGLPATPARYLLQGLGPRTHINGLYLAGADVLAHGIVGAMLSGFSAVTACGSFFDVIRIFRSILKKS